ncbi:MAG: hypothetical protein JNM63_06510 [Spirochaetia bacterium]|nr:hypothetical protein [Spirochaetia bacterium]
MNIEMQTEIESRLKNPGWDRLIARRVLSARRKRRILSLGFSLTGGLVLGLLLLNLVNPYWLLDADALLRQTGLSFSANEWSALRDLAGAGGEISRF